MSRPELEIFVLAMLGGGKMFGVAHIYDKPIFWREGVNLLTISRFLVSVLGVSSHCG